MPLPRPNPDNLDMAPTMDRAEGRSISWSGCGHGARAWIPGVGEWGDLAMGWGHGVVLFFMLYGLRAI